MAGALRALARIESMMDISAGISAFQLMTMPDNLPPQAMAASIRDFGRQSIEGTVKPGPSGRG